jgi:hypothetical protein
MPLSIYRDGKGPAVMVAGAVFWTSPTASLINGSKVSFEVLETDVGTLKKLVGSGQYFVADSETHFFGRLDSLEPCVSTHTGLARMRDRPTLLGTVSVFRGDGAAH